MLLKITFTVMKKVLTVLSTLVLVMAFGLSYAEATIIDTNWWSNRTSFLNTIEADISFAGPERIRLGNFTNGFLEGTVSLPSVDIWDIDFQASYDSELGSDTTDFVNILINGSLVGTFNNDQVYDVSSQVTGSSFDYRFEFTSSNNKRFLHQVVEAGTATTAAPIPEPSTWLLLAVGIFGIIGMGYRQRKKVA